MFDLDVNEPPLGRKDMDIEDVTIPDVSDELVEEVEAFLADVLREQSTAKNL